MCNRHIITSFLGIVSVKAEEICKKNSRLFVETQDADTFNYGAEFIKRLAYAGDVTVAASFENLGNVVTIITESAKIYIPMGELVDFDKRLVRRG